MQREQVNTKFLVDKLDELSVHNSSRAFSSEEARRNLTLAMAMSLDILGPRHYMATSILIDILQDNNTEPTFIEYSYSPMLSYIQSSVLNGSVTSNTYNLYYNSYIEFDDIYRYGHLTARCGLFVPALKWDKSIVEGFWAKLRNKPKLHPIEKDFRKLAINLPTRAWDPQVAGPQDKYILDKQYWY